jgi:hypothetical protein
MSASGLVRVEWRVRSPKDAHVKTDRAWTLYRYLSPIGLDAKLSAMNAQDRVFEFRIAPAQSQISNLKSQMEERS